MGRVVCSKYVLWKWGYLNEFWWNADGFCAYSCICYNCRVMGQWAEEIGLVHIDWGVVKNFGGEVAKIQENWRPANFVSIVWNWHKCWIMGSLWNCWLSVPDFVHKPMGFYLVVCSLNVYVVILDPICDVVIPVTRISDDRSPFTWYSGFLDGRE